MYIDYETYLTMGGKAEETEFSRLEYMAGKKLERYTFRRIKNTEKPSEAVQRCMAELINAMARADPVQLMSEAPLSGFSNDGYSESYGQPLTAESLEKSLLALAYDFLAAETDKNGVPLLWAGVTE